jgi:hypothetical protein
VGRINIGNVATLLVASLVLAGPAAAQTQFARVDTDADKEPRALQLGIVTYAAAGLSVDLVSAIHIGDRAYYTELNELFPVYDAVLFELVAHEGSDIASQVSQGRGLLSTAQIGLTKLLDLSFQLDEIDYGAANFVHADLSPDELRESMETRDESLYVYFWRIFFATINEYAKDPLGLKDLELLSSMVESGKDASLKLLMAYEMTNMESVRDILGEDSDSAIVGARNRRAVDVLRQRIGRGDRHIGIFYGVAHMPDLEHRLIDEFGLAYEKTRWVDAWQLGGD